MPIEIPVEKRFLFNGGGVAFGGRIRRPDNLFLPAAGVAHLPVTGGLSESHVTGRDATRHHYKKYLKFSEAHSTARGDYKDPRQAVQYTHGNYDQNPLAATTKVESKLLNLEIDAEAHQGKSPRRTFRAKRLEVRTTMTTSWDAQNSTIRTLSAYFEGITLQTGDPKTSHPVRLRVLMSPQIFCDHATKAELMAKYAKDASFRKKYGNCFHPLDAGVRGLGNSIPFAKNGPIVATFVTGLEWVGGKAPEGTQILNNRLIISGLGRLYFGEIVIDDRFHRITTLRFELGCKVGGATTGPDVSTYITHIPPQTP